MPDDRERLEALTRSQPTVAGKIRALAGAGVPRADIARFLGKRYQHVRNVLEDDAQRAGGGSPGGDYVMGRVDLSGVQDPGARSEGANDERDWVERRGETAYWLRPRPDGALVLPKEVADALELTDGRRVFAQFEDGVLTIIGGAAAMRRAIARVRAQVHVPSGVSVVDEFIAERRALWGEDDD
jgi:hypothetical protein